MIVRGGAQTSTTLVAWNVRGYRPRTQEVDNLFTNPSISTVFLSETKQGRRRDGTPIPMEFAGTKISMPAVISSGPAGVSMGIAFVTKTEPLRRVASLQCDNARWQMLVVETRRLRLIGVYIRPSSNKATWETLLAHLKTYRAKSRPTVVCGDFNAHHTRWTKGPKDVGGNALHKWLNEAVGPEGAKSTASTFTLHAPSVPTYSMASSTGLAEATLDLFLTANLRSFTTTAPKLALEAGVGGSDHAPIVMTVRHPPIIDSTPRMQFLPTPHRRTKPELREPAVLAYNQKIPSIVPKFDSCVSQSAFDDAYDELMQVTTAPWNTMAAPKPARFRDGWTRQLDDIAKERTRQMKKQHSRKGTKQDRKVAGLEVRRYTRLIARLLKKQRHDQRDEEAAKLAAAADARDVVGAAKILRRHQRQAGEADLVGDALDPQDFTTFFARKSAPTAPIPLQKFDLQPEFRDVLLMAIKRAKRGKAPGPDGVPVEIYQMAPEVFADVFFALFRACGRLGVVPPGWDLSILIPIYKKGLTSLPANYRPLRLIQALKKIFGIALDATLREEIANDIAQFGFQPGVSAMEALVLAIAHTQIPDMLTIAVDQKGAYDTVDRATLMELVAERCSSTTAALVRMVLQPSQVYTKGDILRLLLTLDVGLTQGGPDSPALFNIMADLLFQMIDEELLGHLLPSDPAPKKGFADDLLLQLLRLLNAKRALLGCGRWEKRTGQTFTVAVGKSASLAREDDPQDLDLRVNGKRILPATTFEYLGVTLSATGPTTHSLDRRVAAASSAMTNLRMLDLLVRGMNLSHATFLYDTFIVSKWTYASFLQPLTITTLARLNAIDAGFISATLLACRVAGKAKRRSTLPVLRALLRIPSPALRRQILAHQYVARLGRLTTDPKTSQPIRYRAQAARQALPQVPGLAALVPDFARPWDRNQVKQACADEWQRATRFSRRKIPGPVPGRHLPPAARLRH